MKYRSFSVLCFHFNLLLIWLNNGMVNAIVGGEYAEFGQFRYIVSIRDRNRQHTCGGAIIHEEYIITAAHCFIDKYNNFKNEKYTVVAGAVNLDMDSPGRIVFNVLKVFIPTQYNKINPNPSNTDYREVADIALVQVNDIIRFGPQNLDKLHLPEKRDGHYVQYMKQRPFVMGFGMEAPFNPTGKRGRGYLDNKLKYIQTTVLHKGTCKTMWPNTKIYDSYVCAQADQKKPFYSSGVCDGDSGSPLVLDDVVIAILGTTRPDCNEKYNSALYTRVTAFMTFITNVMNKIKSDDVREADYNDNSVIEIVSKFTDLFGSHGSSNVVNKKLL